MIRWPAVVLARSVRGGTELVLRTATLQRRELLCYGISEGFGIRDVLEKIVFKFLLMRVLHGLTCPRDTPQLSRNSTTSSAYTPVPGMMLPLQVCSLLVVASSNMRALTVGDPQTSLVRFLGAW